MNVLVINAGSSSLKYQLIDMDTQAVMAKGLCERIGIEGSCLKHTPAGKDAIKFESPMKDHSDAIKMVIDALVDKDHGVIADMSAIDAVGHRVVHGGEYFNKSVIIDDDVMAKIDECSMLAPLHNPANLIGIKACQAAMPGVPMVAVFDTAFHQTMPAKAYMYALPYDYYEKYKVRRYGFHGTSHYYVANRCAELMGKPIEDLKIITLHLGNGSSITAVDGGKSVDTSMGFTPLAGVPMGTRSGLIDPAILSFLKEKEGLSDAEMDNVLNKKSGVFGLSGLSSDFRDLTEGAEKGDARCKLALDVFEYRVKCYIGYYIAAMGGVDAVVFTAGVGENSVALRGRILEGLEYLGITCDKEKNNVSGKDAIISKDGAAVTVFAIPTNEELTIALDTQKLLK